MAELGPISQIFHLEGVYTCSSPIMTIGNVFKRRGAIMSRNNSNNSRGLPIIFYTWEEIRKDQGDYMRPSPYPLF